MYVYLGGGENVCVCTHLVLLTCAVSCANNTQGHYKTRTDSECKIHLTTTAVSVRGKSVSSIYHLVECFQPQLPIFHLHHVPTWSDLLLWYIEPGQAVGLIVVLIEQVDDLWRLRSGWSCWDTGVLLLWRKKLPSAGNKFRSDHKMPFWPHSLPSVPCRTSSMWLGVTTEVVMWNLPVVTQLKGSLVGSLWQRIRAARF